MEDFFTGVVIIIVVIVMSTGLFSIFDYMPNSYYIGKGTCCVCGEEKKETCTYKEYTKAKGSNTVISYTLCEDCVIDFCRKNKKAEPVEGNKDERRETD